METPKPRGVGAETAGVMLIVAGLVFAVERLLGGEGAWKWLPMLVVFVGARDFRAPAPGRDPSIMLFLMGLWLQISAIGFLGFDFLNSWPLLIVFVGLGLLVDGIIEDQHPVPTTEPQGDR